MANFALAILMLLFLGAMIVLFTRVLVTAFRTGEMPARSAHYNRRTHPVAFWALAAGYALLVAGMVAFVAMFGAAFFAGR